MADSPTQHRQAEQRSTDRAPVLAGTPQPILGSCGCSSGCSCGCQSGSSCQCGGSCG